MVIAIETGYSHLRLGWGGAVGLCMRVPDLGTTPSAQPLLNQTNSAFEEITYERTY